MVTTIGNVLGGPGSSSTGPTTDAGAARGMPCVGCATAGPLSCRSNSKLAERGPTWGQPNERPERAQRAEPCLASPYKLLPQN